MGSTKGKKHMSQHDASRLDERAQLDADDHDEDDEPELPAEPPGPAAAEDLEAATAGWLRRGYMVRYRDPYLLQLMRREPPGWREAVLLGLATAAAVAAVAFGLHAYQRRLWHVVTLVIRPDGRIVTHQIRAPRRPAP
jgi:hypothetical protein